MEILWVEAPPPHLEKLRVYEGICDQYNKSQIPTTDNCISQLKNPEMFLDISEYLSFKIIGYYYLWFK